MTVAQVIEALSALPGEMRVVGRGYESGYDDIDVDLIEVTHHPDNPYYEGKFQKVRRGAAGARVVAIS